MLDIDAPGATKKFIDYYINLNSWFYDYHQLKNKEKPQGVEISEAHDAALNVLGTIYALTTPHQRSKSNTYQLQHSIEGSAVKPATVMIMRVLKLPTSYIDIVQKFITG